MSITIEQATAVESIIAQNAYFGFAAGDLEVIKFQSIQNVDEKTAISWDFIFNTSNWTPEQLAIAEAANTVLTVEDDDSVMGSTSLTVTIESGEVSINNSLLTNNQEVADHIKQLLF